MPSNETIREGFLVALGSLVILLAIVITLTIGWIPFFGPKARALTNRSFERTPQRLERKIVRVVKKEDSSAGVMKDQNSQGENQNPMVKLRIAEAELALKAGALSLK